ncbi:AraC family transcriptional regulator [Fulvitalea axinellae]|uniref:AraC family transcriptional regulator n=1 Tax=Fulvitalea axinellae TaxID=1182444 RepID=A0AAU9CSU8_9BACT|nr:AraC family transcriptional regulator [Fulvitalea axinellae]
MIKGPPPHKYSLDEFFRAYFKEGPQREYLRKGNPDNFLIAKVVEYKDIIKTPIPPYLRSVAQLHCITEGEVTVKCNLNEVTIGKGQVHLWQEDQSTSLLDISHDAQGFYCHFSYEFLAQSPFVANIAKQFQQMTKRFERLNLYMHHRPLNLDHDTLGAVLRVLERMHTEYHGTHNVDKIQAYLFALLFEVNGSLPEQFELCNFSRQEELMNNFKSAIFRHISEERSVKFYADKLHVSPNHLNKSVKQLTGETARDWITKALIISAKILLKQTALNINEIAFQLGYDDPSYFTRFFKKNVGLLPKDYRETELQRQSPPKVK